MPAPPPPAPPARLVNPHQQFQFSFLDPLRRQPVPARPALPRVPPNQLALQPVIAPQPNPQLPLILPQISIETQGVPHRPVPAAVPPNVELGQRPIRVFTAEEQAEIRHLTELGNSMDNVPNEDEDEEDALLWA